MYKKFLSYSKYFIASVMSFFPVFLFAQTFRDFVVSTTELISGLLIPLLFSAALALFIWGVADFIRSAENSDERKKGKQRILWGIIALFVMVAFFGIVSIFTRQFFGTGVFLPQLFTND